MISVQSITVFGAHFQSLVVFELLQPYELCRLRSPSLCKFYHAKNLDGHLSYLPYSQS